MPNLNISEILRHLAIGFIAFGLALVVDPSASRKALSDMGTVGASLTAFTIGAFLYNLYRPLILIRIIHRLKDWIVRSEGNYRRFLFVRYGMSCRDAEYFWYHVRENQIPDRLETWRRGTSGVHFLYMTSLLTLATAGYSAIYLSHVYTASLFSVVFVTGIAGLVQDLDFERCEYFALKSIDLEDLDACAVACGYKLKKNNSEPDGNKTTPPQSED